MSETGSKSTDRQNIEVWNDLVSPKDLVVCLLISVVCAVAAVPIASRIGGQTLFWGLGASVAGFIVNCLLVTPKREVVIVDDADGVDVADGIDVAGGIEGADLVGAGGGGGDE